MVVRIVDEDHDGPELALAYPDLDYSNGIAWVSTDTGLVKLFPTEYHRIEQSSLFVITNDKYLSRQQGTFTPKDDDDE